MSENQEPAFTPEALADVEALLFATDSPLGADRIVALTALKDRKQVKAAIVALKDLPAVNAEIDGEELVYKNHYDIGVAVGTEQGLVVPVLRDADRLDFAEIEKGVAELGRKARDGALTMEEIPTVARSCTSSWRTEACAS